MAEQQQNLGNPNPFAQRGKAMAQANHARRSSNRSPFVENGQDSDPSNPFAYREASRKTPQTGDVKLRNDDIVSALKEGGAELHDPAGNIIGYENNRLNLLVDQETRKLLDILPYSPSREEALANIIRRECRNMTEEEQYKLACLDTNINRSVIKPMLMKSELKRQSIEQVVPQRQDLPEPPSSPVVVGQPPVQVKTAGEPPAVRQDPVTDPFYATQPPMRAVPNPGSQECLQPSASPARPVQQVLQISPRLNLPFANAPAPRVPLIPEKSVTLTCPIGRYKVPVLDVVQKPGYIVIIQREDTSFLVAFEANHVTYRLDVVDADLEYSGITYEFNGAVHTVMVMK